MSTAGAQGSLRRVGEARCVHQARNAVMESPRSEVQGHCHRRIHCYILFSCIESQILQSIRHNLLACQFKNKTKQKASVRVYLLSSPNFIMAGNSSEQSRRTSYTSKGKHESSERTEAARLFFFFFFLFIFPREQSLGAKEHGWSLFVEKGVQRQGRRWNGLSVERASDVL